MAKISKGRIDPKQAQDVRPVNTPSADEAEKLEQGRIITQSIVSTLSTVLFNDTNAKDINDLRSKLNKVDKGIFGMGTFKAIVDRLDLITGGGEDKEKSLVAANTKLKVISQNIDKISTNINTNTMALNSIDSNMSDVLIAADSITGILEEVNENISNINSSSDSGKTLSNIEQTLYQIDERIKNTNNEQKKITSTIDVNFNNVNEESIKKLVEMIDGIESKEPNAEINTVLFNYFDSLSKIKFDTITSIPIDDIKKAISDINSLFDDIQKNNKKSVFDINSTDLGKFGDHAMLLEKISETLKKISSLDLTITLPKTNLVEVIDEIKKMSENLSSKINDNDLKAIKNTSKLTSDINKTISPMIEDINKIFQTFDNIVKDLDIDSFNKNLDNTINIFTGENKIQKLYDAINGSGLSGQQSSFDLSAADQIINVLVNLSNNLEKVNETAIINNIDKINKIIKSETGKKENGSLVQLINNIDEFIKKNNLEKKGASQNTKNLLESINSIVTILNTISSSKIGDDVTKNIGTIKTSLGSSEGISGIVDELINLANKDEGGKKISTAKVTIDTLRLLFDSLTKLADIDNKKISNIKKTIKVIQNDLLDGIVEIAKKIQNIKSGLKKQSDSIKTISEFFSSISSLGDIGLKKRLNMAFNIWYIKNFLANDIVSISETLKDTANLTTKKQKDSFEAIEVFFKAIILLADLDKDKRKNMKSNVAYIKNYITSMVVDISKSLVKAAELTDKQTKTFDILHNFIEHIIKISELSLGKKFSMWLNTWFIKSYIVGSYTGIIESLVDVTNKVEADKDKIDILKSFIDNLLFIGDIGVLKLISIELKLEWINSIITDGYSSLIKNFNEVVLDEALKKMDQLQDFINGLSNINDSLGSYKSLLSTTMKIYLLGVQTFGYSVVADNFRSIDLGDDKNKIDNLTTVINGLLVLNVGLESSKDLVKHIVSIMLLADELDNISNMMKKINNIKEADKDIIRNINNDHIVEIAKLNTLISDILSVEDNIKKIELVKTEIDTLSDLIDYLNSGNISNYQSSADNLDIIEDDLKIITGIFANNSNIAKNLENLITIDTKALSSIVEGIDKLTNISDKISKYEVQDDFKDKIYALGKVANLVNKDGKFGSSLENLVTVDTKKFGDIIDSLDELVKLSKKVIALSGTGKEKVLETSIKAFEGIPVAMKVVIDKFGEIDNESIEKAKNITKTFIEIVVASAAIMVIGALAMTLVNPVDLIAFAVTLSTFMMMVMTAFRIGAKSLSQALECSKEFSMLLLASSFILIFGSMAMLYVRGDMIVAFILSLSSLIFSVIGAYNLATRDLEKVIDVSEEFVKLIAISSLCLIIGSKLMEYISLADVVTFVLSLTTFIGLTIAAYGLATQLIDETKKTAGEFLMLVTISSAILILGATAIKQQDMIGSTFAFVGALVLMISGILGVFYLAKKFGMDSLLEDARNMAILVSLSGFILILGATMVILYPWIILGAIGFTILLGGFILAMSYVYTIASKMVQDSMKAANQLAMLVLVSGAILLLGGAVMMIDGLALGALEFAAILGGFIFLVTFAYKRNMKDIQTSISAALGLAALVAISSVVLLVGGSLLIANPYLVIGVIGFGVILAGFIWVICHAAYGKENQKLLFNSMKGALALGLLVVVSGAVLLTAAKIIGTDFKLIGAIALFAIILSGFICVISWAYSKWGKDIVASIPASIALGILTVISGLTLMIGAKFIEENPMRIVWVLAFGALLCGYVMLVSYAMDYIGKKMVSILKGGLAMLAVVAITWLATFAFEQVGALITKYDFVTLIKGVGSMLACLAALTVGYIALGALAAAGSIGLGFAIVGMTLVSAVSLLIIHTLKTINDNKSSLDTTNLSKFQAAAIALADIGAKLGDAFTIKNIAKLMLVSKSISTLSKTLDDIAQVVNNYANLRVGEDYKADKFGVLRPTRYRAMKTSDFRNAAKNISLVITTIGSAVIDTYNKKPDLFETSLFGNSPFANVSKSLKTLGPMISKIAEAVKDYADFKIKIYNGTKFVGYRRLDKKDFENAGNNVKSIIETLGSAVISSYEKNPHIFETSFFGNSPFSKVTKSLGTLGPMISTIAKAVQNYANMKIADEYTIDKNGNAIAKSYRKMNEDDFVNAANNVQHIITTLGAAVIGSYEMNPDMFETNFFGNSPFSKVVKSLKTLGPMISSIAKAVKDYSNMVVQDYVLDEKTSKFVADGNPRQLDSKDFQKAADNVNLIISTLGGAIIAAYEAHPDYYEGGDGGWFSKGSKFNQTITSNMKLASLIKKIASAVKDYAALRIVEYDENGKEKGYRKLTDKDFQDAARNVKVILSILGDSIISAYEAHPDYYEGGDGGWFSKGSPFNQTVTANMKLANLIKKISSAIKDYAQLKITSFDDNGKETTRNLTRQDFKNAATNISTIITVLGSSIMETYNKNPKWFKSGEDSEFGQACTAISTMGNMINNIAQGIQNYADLKIPVYGEDGKISTYQKIDDKTFENAAENIGKLVSTLGSSIIQFYEEHPEYFKDGEDSTFSIVMNATAKMGEMISNVSTSVQAFATLRIPTKYNENGEPIDFQTLGKEEIQKAGDNIKLIISTVGNAIISLYESDKGKSMFQIDPKAQDTIFDRVVNSCAAMGDMIGSIAEGVAQYASLEIPKYSNGKLVGVQSLDDMDFKTAADNIEKIITTIGGAIIKTFDGHKDWFTLQPLKKKSGFLGLMDVEEVNNGDTPFMKVIQGCAAMGGMIASIAEGVRQFASQEVPVYDNNKIVGYQKMNDDEYDKAADNISNIISTIGGAIMKTFEKHKDWFQNTSFSAGGFLGLLNISTQTNSNGTTPFDKVIQGCASMGGVISSIAEGVRQFASQMVPEYDATGTKITRFVKLDKNDYKKAGEQIGTVLTTLGKAMNDTYTWNQQLFNNPNLDKIMKSYLYMGKIITTMANGIRLYASMQIPQYDENHKIVKYLDLDDNLINDTKTQIVGVMTCVADAVSSIVNRPEYKDVTSLNNFVAVFSKMSGSILGIGKTVQAYASMTIPKINDKGEITGYEKFNEENTKGAIGTIQSIITAVGKGIAGAITENPELFGQANGFKEWLMRPKKESLPVMVAAELIAKVADPIKSLVDVIVGLAGGELISYKRDAKGNIVSEQRTKISDAAITKAQGNIRKILTSVAQTITDIYNQNPTAYNVKDGNSPVNLVIEGIEKTVDMINSTYTVLDSLTKVEVVDDKVLDKLTENIQKRLLTIAELNQLMVAYKKDNLIDQTRWSPDRTFYDYIMASWSGRKNNVKDVINQIVDMIDDVISSVNTIIGYGNNLGKPEDFTQTADKVTQVVGTCLKLLVDVYTNEYVSKIPTATDSKTIFDNANTFIDEQTETIIRLLMAVKRIEDTASGLDKDLLTSTVQSICSGFVSCVSSLSQLAQFQTQSSSNNSGIMGFVNNMLGGTNEEPLTDTIDNFADNINRIINLSILASEDNGGYDILANGINTIQNAVDNIKSTKIFAQHGEQLQKYVKTVNSINIQKIDKLTTFAKTLNELGKRLGNIDKLTDALANNLSVVLDRLVKELQEAKKTFEKADKLQDKRHEEIEKARKNIENMMNQVITVEISEKANELDDTSLENPGNPGSTPLPTDDSTKSTGGGGGGQDASMALGDKNKNIKAGTTTTTTTTTTSNSSSNPNAKPNDKSASVTTREKTTPVAPSKPAKSEPTSVEISNAAATIIGSQIASAIKEEMKKNKSW